MNRLRVVVIGTGNVGGIAVRCLQGRDDVELVGVWGRSQHIGTDAGLLDTDQPCGVIITSDEDAIFALKPDCAVMALNIRDPMEAIQVNGAWHIKLLEAGINVVTASDGSLVFPLASRPGIRRPARGRRQERRRDLLWQWPGAGFRRPYGHARHDAEQHHQTHHLL